MQSNGTGPASRQLQDKVGGVESAGPSLDRAARGRSSSRAFDQRSGVRPGLDLARPDKGGSDLMRRLVKGSPKSAQDFMGRFESKNETRNETSPT